MILRWKRLAVPALAGVSVADNCTSTSSNGFIIDSQAAADALNSCSTVSGNVTIQGSGLTTIALNGIQIIEGNLAASGCDDLQTITAPVLSQISNNFTLFNLPLLASLEFPLLDNVNGGIYWDTLPELTDVSFGNLTAPTYGLPGTNVDGDISIASTGLSSLAFLNFTHYSNPAKIWITRNRQLDTVNLTGLSWGSNSLAIVDNGPSAQIFLPDLRSVGAITIENAGHIDVSSLSETSGSVNISNNAVDVLSVPNLTDIGGSFIVENNGLLDDISLPLLTSVHGDLTVSNNSVLHMIGDLNQLWYCEGSIDLSGDFQTVTLPSLRNIIGGFHLNSSDPDFNCTTFDKLASETSWSSSFYSCGAYVPGSPKDLAIHYQTPNNEFKLSKPVKAIIIILSVIVGLFLCALLLRLYSRKTAGRRGSLSRNRSREDGVDLDETGVTRSAEEGADALPKYRRVGEPGEVPPVYQASEDAVEAGNQNTEMASSSASVTARRRWFFWS
ncbi:uncharacterized protein LY89DRAFT_412796 [Mollisia scopiformis]|uniref:Uncharacterized protein n=1 Tax=Mollisia scopiformis TaxID=149040 RepID=A0A132B1R5_MOLSC|nr:uncharacterized protein LY89DRAFT_412796 [Mollisia scopiformis]KUJ06312.1 hypothetical protein LY89DRAFT_412796 [Mollisia scopiformis]